MKTKMIQKAITAYMNLSPSRTTGGVSAEAAAIPAVDPHANGHSDNAQTNTKDSLAHLGAQPSRRGFIMNTIVSAAAVASATAIPTLDAGATDLSPPMGVDAELDGELISLGDQFGAGFKALVDAHEGFDKIHDDFFALVDREAPPQDENLNAHLAWIRQAEEATELGREFRRRGEMIDAAALRLEPLTKSIQSIPALSLSGLGIKAKASAVSSCHLWRDPLDEMDWADRAFRCLIEGNLAAAGLPTAEQYLGENLLKWWQRVPKRHPDAELLALVEQWNEADANYRELVDAVERMDQVIYAYKSRPVPEALRWRAKDQKLGLPSLHLGRDGDQQLWWTNSGAVKSIRGKSFLMGFTPKNRMEVKPVFKSPSKTARARADEIIAAYDGWAKEAKPPRGYKKAVREREKADDIATALENKIIEKRATTVDGLLAKIKVAYRPADLTYGIDELERLQLEQMGGRADEIAVSIFRDLQRWALNGTEAASQSVAPSGSAVHPDAELVALGRQYEVLLDKYYRRRVAWSTKPMRSSVVVSKEMSAEMESLDRAIRSLSATTLEGLRAKALPAFYDVAPLSHGETVYHFEDDFAFRDLFEAVVNVVGLTDKVAATGYQMPSSEWLDD